MWPSIRIGETPLILLESFSNDNIKIFAKLEWFNPFGSIKDRAAYWMLKLAVEEGKLDKSKIIIEPTSGNTGIALAGIGKALGFEVKIVVPSRISIESIRLIKDLGADVITADDDLCPRLSGTDGAIALAKEIVSMYPDEYFMPNQYENEANFIAHYKGTGPEIWRELNGKITHFVAGIGTGGTITGVGKYLKEMNSNIKIYAVEPQRNHNIQGLRNLEESETPGILKRRINLIDKWVKVSDEDAFRMVRLLAEREKLFVGPSSGAIAYALLKLKKNIKKGIIVGIFADNGLKYISLYKRLRIFSESELKYYLKRSKYMRKI